MSQTDARSFVERIAEDEALRRDVIGALNGNAEKAAQEMIELGSRQGLSFTTAEIGEAVAEWQRNHPAELSESALEAVSGGIDALSQTADFRLQYPMQQENRIFTAVSNILKTKNDTTKNSITNIK